MANWFMKEPCQHCPYRRDVRPFLRGERAEELAYLTENKYSEFHCHKTVDYDEDEDGCVTQKSLMCAGFLSLQVNNCIETPDGFQVSDLAYSDVHEMLEAYEDEAAGRWEAPAWLRARQAVR